jgi:hypothetical protein
MPAPTLRAEDLAEVLGDFPSFCSLLPIKLKSGGTVRFDHSRWHHEQQRFERERTGRDAVIKPRQIGFSTLELARDFHTAVTRKGVNVQVVTHDAELKAQMFLVVRAFAEGLKVKGLLPKTRYSTKTELVFADTDSALRIVEAGDTEHAAAKKGRSGTIHRLHATEMAFWGAAAETWTALDAAVPDDGEVVIESTANGAGGLFYEMVMGAREGRGRFKCHFFAWYDHKTYRLPLPFDFDPAPRDKWERKLRAGGCDDGQIAWWRAKVDSPEWGLDRTLQEYPVDADSCFRVAGRQYFSPDTIDELLEHERAPLHRIEIKHEGRLLGHLNVFEMYDSRDVYVVGADVAEGTGADADSATVLSKKTARTVATFWSDSIEPGDFGLALTYIGKIYGTALLAPERNNHGHAALRAIITEAKYPIGRVYHAQDDKPGWLTSSVTRPVMIDELGAAVRTKTMVTPDRATIAECKTLVRNDQGKVEARKKGTKDGSKDDRWMSWCIAFQVRNTPVKEITPLKGRIPGW